MASKPRKKVPREAGTSGGTTELTKEFDMTSVDQQQARVEAAAKALDWQELKSSWRSARKVIRNARAGKGDDK